MAKSLVNAKCAECGEFRPRCAVIHPLTPLSVRVATPEAVKLCEGCRKKFAGRFRLDARHRRAAVKE